MFRFMILPPILDVNVPCKLPVGVKARREAYAAFGMLKKEDLEIACVEQRDDILHGQVGSVGRRKKIGASMVSCCSRMAYKGASLPCERLMRPCPLM